MQHNDLFKQLFNRNPREVNNDALLLQEANEFPYFGLIHFYLLKETGVAHEKYKSIAGKLALHFNNAYLLNIQLNKKISAPLPAEKTSNIPDSISDSPFVEKPFLINLDTQQEVRNNKEELLFEPLHITDYFASLGIKLSEEQKSDDQLGKQLKSFTDWLKTMKKTNFNKLPEITEQLEAVVQKLAETSNNPAEVITESMAEVLIQQGKRKKAFEVYEKLSLQNPAKSAYFANKIESLKDI